MRSTCAPLNPAGLVIPSDSTRALSATSLISDDRSEATETRSFGFA
jgi:hypothetical protein